MAELVPETLEDALPPPELERPRSRIWVLVGWCLKIALLVGIFVYLFSTGKLTFERLGEQAKHWDLALLAMSMAIPALLACSLRYQLLLRALKVTTTYWDIVALSMIGMLFDLISPVSNGGDLVKAVYLKKSTSGPVGTPGGKKGFGIILFSVLMDRIIGLFALFIFALLVCVVAWPQIRETPELRRTAFVVVAVCAIGLAAFFVLVSETLENSARRKRLMHILPFHGKIEAIYAGFAGLRHHKLNLLVMLGLSIVNHVASCGAILILAQGMTFNTVAPPHGPAPLPFFPCLTVLPLGLFATTFGPAGGLGGGNYAFDKLFNIVLGLTGGGNLVLAFQICGILFRLTGIPVLMFYRHKGAELAPAHAIRE